MRTILTALLAAWPVLVVGGCPSDTSENQTAAGEFDGQWQLQSTSGKPPACITVSGGRITIFDEGCAGNFGLVVSLLPVSVSGNDVVWVFTLAADGTTQTITLTGQVQADGSIRGSVQAVVAGAPVLSTFTMTRR